MKKDIEKTVHIPVMLNEILEEMFIKKSKNIVDATLGGGSYTRAFYQNMMKGGRVIAIDRDLTAIERFKKFYPELSDKITFVHKSYSHIKDICGEFNFKPDRIVADFGLSSDQLKEENRGFSFLLDDPIDMRMDASRGVPASEAVNKYSIQELSRIFRVYGDEKYAGKIALAITKSRPILTTGELSKLIEEVKKGSKSKTHPATKVFQALRIFVNDEYREIEVFLKESIEILRIGGYLGVVSFHSGEDRIVKNIFREYSKSCKCPPSAPVCVCDGKPILKIKTKNGLTPSKEEIKNNPRSRSARLRIAQKIN